MHRNTLFDLKRVLRKHSALAIAVSGGLDSMTLAHVAHQVHCVEVKILHAVSPAVDQESTNRVKDTAKKFGWDLNVIEPGEFSDQNYLKNPVNRCFFCKSNLYARISNSTSSVIASGTNLDDLSDYRPGLKAANNFNVVHPFVEARVNKSDIRALARELGLPEIAELPAQPCLASRIETGIAINAQDLAFVEKVEGELKKLFPNCDLRCRIVRNGVRVELSASVFDDNEQISQATALALEMCQATGRQLLNIGKYKQGSAFLHGK